MVDIGMVEQHNQLSMQINRAKTVDDIRPLVPMVRNFCTTYQNVDEVSTNRIYDLCVNKLHSMVEENEAMFAHMTERLRTVNGYSYDFAGEKDDSQAVNSMALQLMSQLPKTMTAANAGKVAGIIEQATRSVIGSKAVLELMKFPAYADMVSERYKQRAFEGCKSEAQKTFEGLKERELRSIEKARAAVIMDGFHLRNLEKKIVNFKKPTVWG